jgi:Phage integrase family
VRILKDLNGTGAGAHRIANRGVRSELERLHAPSANRPVRAADGYFDFRFAHIDGLISSDPAVYARLPKVHRDESRTHGLDRLELIRFLQVAQTLSVHHGALAYALGINALRASEAAAVRIEDYADTLRGYRVLHLVGKGNKPATMPLTVPVLRVLEACRGQRTSGPLDLRPVSAQPIDRRDAYRMVARIAKAAGIPRHISPHSLRHAAIITPRRRRSPARRPDPGPPRRPAHHRALRPRPRQPRPTRRPLPHRLRRRRLRTLWPVERRFRPVWATHIQSHVATPPLQPRESALPIGPPSRELRSREECAHASLTSDSHTDDNGVFSARGSSDAGRVR